MNYIHNNRSLPFLTDLLRLLLFEQKHRIKISLIQITANYSFANVGIGFDCHLIKKKHFGNHSCSQTLQNIYLHLENGKNFIGFYEQF